MNPYRKLADMPAEPLAPFSVRHPRLMMVYQTLVGLFIVELVAFISLGLGYGYRHSPLYDILQIGDRQRPLYPDGLFIFFIILLFAIVVAMIVIGAYAIGKFITVKDNE